MPTAARANSGRMKATSPEPARSAAARAVSALSAGLLSLLLLVYPPAVTGADGSVSHTALSLLLLALAGGWGHALGYRPRALATRLWMHPAFVWPGMALGLLLSRA